MSAFLYSLLGFLAAIAILVTVHEYGHFWVARKLGVKVLRFSIGFGRPIVRWRRAGDPTEYCIGLFPLGGYVKMLDQSEGEVAPQERDMAFDRQPLAARSAIVFAGPAFNFLFAILAIWLVLAVGSDGIEPRVGAVAENSAAQRAGFRVGDRLLRVDGRAVQTWGEHQLYLMHRAMRGDAVEFEVAAADGAPRRMRVDFADIDQYALGSQAVTAQIGLAPPPPEAIVHRVVAGSPAAAAGLRAGDRIVAIDGDAIDDWGAMVRSIAARPGQRVALRVHRDGALLEVDAAIGASEVDGVARGRIGLYRPPLENARLRYGPLEALPAAIDYNWRLTVVTLRSLGRMLSARMSAENLSGPITIARIAGRTASQGYDDFLKFLAIISISLGLINLMPVPLLDGGHLLYFAYEAIAGRRPSERALLRGQYIGIALLVLLMGVAFYNDIMRLI